MIGTVKAEKIWVCVKILKKNIWNFPFHPLFHIPRVLTKKIQEFKSFTRFDFFNFVIQKFNNLRFHCTTTTRIKG